MIVNLNNRLRFIIVTGLVIVPMASVMSIILMAVYLPVHNSMDQIVHEVIDEIVPMTRLESNLHRAIMPPNDYLIHGDPQEKDIWDKCVEEIDQNFRTLKEQVSFEEEKKTIEEMGQKWQHVKLLGGALLNSEFLDYNRKAAGQMEEFDSKLYEITDRLQQLRKSKYQVVFIAHQDAMEKKKWAMTLSITTIVLSLGAGLGAGIFLTRDHESLVNKSNHDSLTGAYNRRAFEKKLKNMTSCTLRSKKQYFSLLMMDIDHFKEVNDTYGHQAGDVVICHFCRHISNVMRSDDFFSRWGGEEFVLLLPATSKATALQVAERIRGLLEQESALTSGGTKVPVTISVGVSTFPEDGKTVSGLIDAVDNALYKAKNNGRNCVVGT